MRKHILLLRSTGDSHFRLSCFTDVYPPECFLDFFGKKRETTVVFPLYNKEVNRVNWIHIYRTMLSL